MIYEIYRYLYKRNGKKYLYSCFNKREVCLKLFILSEKADSVSYSTTTAAKYVIIYEIYCYNARNLLAFSSDYERIKISVEYIPVEYRNKNSS